MGFGRVTVLVWLERVLFGHAVAGGDWSYSYPSSLSRDHLINAISCWKRKRGRRPNLMGRWRSESEQVRRRALTSHAYSNRSMTCGLSGDRCKVPRLTNNTL
jgi:hypothetical protein